MTLPDSGGQFGALKATDIPLRKIYSGGSGEKRFRISETTKSRGAGPFILERSSPGPPLQGRMEPYELCSRM